jgi:hypothetical protein
LIINNNQAYLLDNFHLIKQRYSALADFNLSRSKFFFLIVEFFYLKLFKMANNYELHLNQIIYLLYLKQLQMVDMEKVGKVK